MNAVGLFSQSITKREFKVKQASSTILISRRAVLLGAAAGCATAWGQAFPSHAVSISVMYPAGSAPDVTARLFQPLLTKDLGQPVIVENVSGAGGTIGVQKVLAGAADGHNLLIASPTELILSPISIPSVKYRAEDLRLFGVVGSVSFALMARADLPANNIQELIALSKKPGTKELSYGSVGPGSVLHLMGAQLARLTGMQMLHVPYKGTPPLSQDMLGGQIDMAFLPLAGGFMGLIGQGKLKVLGVATLVPLAAYPKLPTLASQDKALAGFEFDAWAGLLLSRKAPDSVVTRLNKSFNDALRDPELRRGLESTGITLASPMTTSELDSFFAEQIGRYRALAAAIPVSN